MKPTLRTVGLVAGLMVSTVARAQNTNAPAVANVGTGASEAVPTAPAPTMLPPPPASVVAPPVADQVVAPPVVAPPYPNVTQPNVTQGPAGQWVFTQQYGWLWQPYDQSYTYVDERTAVAYQYSYYPVYGWKWVAAPWVLGAGVRPFWGARGPRAFAWYAHPWFHAPRVRVRVQRFGGWGHGGRHGDRHHWP